MTWAPSLFRAKFRFLSGSETSSSISIAGGLESNHRIVTLPSPDCTGSPSCQFSARGSNRSGTSTRPYDPHWKCWRSAAPTYPRTWCRNAGCIDCWLSRKKENPFINYRRPEGGSRSSWTHSYVSTLRPLNDVAATAKFSATTQRTYTAPINVIVLCICTALLCTNYGSCHFLCLFINL